MPQEIIYRIDGQDIIRDVSPGWNEFADANDAAHLTSDAVIGSELLSHISDASTREIYRAILKRVRDGGEARFRLRCDAPSRRRLLEIRIISNDDGAIEFRSSEIAGAERGPRRLLDTTAWRSDDFIRFCSWCNRIDLEGEWYELDDGVARARLFEQALLPMVTHSCCPECEATLDRAIDNLGEPISFSIGHQAFETRSR